MAYCPKCGAEVSGKFCSNCGTMVSDEVKNFYEAGQRGAANNVPPYGQGGAQNNAGAYNPGYQNNQGAYNQGYQNNQGGYYQPGYQNQGAYNPGYQNGGRPAPGTAAAADPNNYKLGWHKFLIYFLLFASGALSLFASVSWFQAGRYYPALAIVGVVEVALAAFVIYVRFPLAKFKKGAPKLLLMAYAATIVVNIIVAFINTFVINAGVPFELVLPHLMPQLLGSIIAPLVWLFINWRYYSSREELFIH